MHNLNRQAVLCNADKPSLHWWRQDETSPGIICCPFRVLYINYNFIADLLVEIASSIVPIHHKECETAR